MINLRITLIDVGWGDSILIESEDGNGKLHYGLVDSNDSQNLRSSYIFLKRHFEKANKNLSTDKPIFDFVLLSHAHSDHIQGLKPVIREFGTQHLWYSKTEPDKSLMFGNLISFAKRSSNVEKHQAIDTGRELPNLGDVELSILWPDEDVIDANNENNNSLVLLLRLGEVSILLTGDSEKEVWSEICHLIPDDVRFFKVPHHGSVNGSFDNDDPAWLDDCPPGAVLGISSHVRPHEHPDSEVITLFEDNGREFYRTDQHYHVTFETNGQAGGCSIKYWH
ncbi:MAG: ComEC/Rec2 family competence protein [Planctomycetota bacterium]